MCGMHAYSEERRVGVTGGDRTKTIYPLTSPRFFLGLSVVVQHTLGPFVPALISDEVLDHGLGGLIFTPAISVSFFFLLSGYVLSLVYLRPGQRVEKRRFFAARFARVYPLFLLTLVLDTPKLLMERAATQGKMVALTKTAITFAAHLVMLHAWW